MRFRQVHLDFHTSGLIAGVGSRFDAEAFARAYRDAHVDSVTLFSKCHHGYSYHPTSVGQQHPGLTFDLLRAQLDALHAVDIKAPIYFSAGWDEYAANLHPEWRIVDPNGKLSQSDGSPISWSFLDFSSPYLDYLCRQVEEVMRNYPDGDGIFLDIAFQPHSTSGFSRKAMEAAGLDWDNPQDRDRHAADVTRHFFECVVATVHKYNPSMPVFFNSGHIRRGQREHIKKYYSHLELESLPTAGWGYDHFPLSARYVDKLGIPFLGMTGKFHYTWGEVGGYKRPEALRYECAAMLAHGARCSIGDHLHPTGAVDQATMRIVGDAYAWVADREAWATGSVNRAEIALLSLEAATRPVKTGAPDLHNPTDEGAVRILLEGGFTFDVVDLQSDFSSYRLLILPDAIAVDAELKAKVEAYVAQGGRVFLTGESGIDRVNGAVFDMGLKWHGRSPMAGGTYVQPIASLQADGIDQPLFMYLPNEQIEITDGQSLGSVYEPYFDRTNKHFSGHLHAPCQPAPSPFAAGAEKNGYVYFSYPLFSCYQRSGAVRILEMAEKLIFHALGGRRLIETSLPRAGRVTVRNQPEEARDIVHLLYANPALRGSIGGANIQPIQDIPDLFNIRVTLETTGSVKAVREVPSDHVVDYLQLDHHHISFVVPVFNAHAMIEVTY